MPRMPEIRKCGKEAATRKLAAKGLTCRQIADELETQGCKVSHVAVARFLREETEERRDAARSVAAKEAVTSVPLVTRVLSDWVNALDRLRVKTEEAAQAELTLLSGPIEAPPKGKAAKGKEEQETPLKRAQARTRVLRGLGQTLSPVIQAGTKAAKALHDITVGDDPATGANELQAEIFGILHAQQKRETDGEG